MQKRRLGRTDIDVSVICLGTMTYGEQNTEAEGHAQMDMALDRGVNFLDAAELYAIPPRPETQGRTEEIIGAWFKARGNRDKVIMATKVVGRTDMNWFRDDGGRAKLDRRNIEEAIDKSLRRLRTDYIDLYQLHWPDRTIMWGSNPTVYVPSPRAADEVPIEETMAVLADIVATGKVRHIGLSNESAWGTMRAVFAAERGLGPRPQSIQNAYHLVNRTFETALAEIAEREQVGLLAYSPLAQGYLTGKYRNGALPPASRKALFDRLQRYEKPGAVEAYEAYLTLADELALDPAQMSIAFAASRPFTTSVIIGATTPTQLEANLAAIDAVPMTPELVGRINAIHQFTMNRAP